MVYYMSTFPCALPSWVWQPKVSLSPSLGHMCVIFQSCSGWSLLSLSFTGYYKVKRGKDPYQELSAPLCHLVTSHDNIPDLQHSQNTQIHTQANTHEQTLTLAGTLEHSIHPTPSHRWSSLNVYTTLECDMFNCTWHVLHPPLKKKKEKKKPQHVNALALSTTWIFLSLQSALKLRPLVNVCFVSLDFSGLVFSDN